jgi:hypothetical protein
LRSPIRPKKLLGAAVAILTFPSNSSGLGGGA